MATYRDAWRKRQFKSIAKSLGYCYWFRLDNLRQDLRARLAGACNADTWDPDLKGYHAYSHWRCAKARGHEAKGVPQHRFNNYIWMGPGSKVEYDPLEAGIGQVYLELSRMHTPFQKLAGGRKPIGSFRKDRIRAREQDRLMKIGLTEARNRQRRRLGSLATREERASDLRANVESALRRAHVEVDEYALPAENLGTDQGKAAPQRLEPTEEAG